MTEKRKTVEYAVGEVARSQIVESGNSQCYEIQRFPLSSCENVDRIIANTENSMCKAW